ncbi:MAG TPA: GNAT family N-acetyltransferase [Bacteroidia bacterium]|nr:GNAT family N-acetyltransferase [Bacteroidia bacterium]
MIVLLEHNKIDKQKWDNCIRECRQGLTYALSWYLDIVAPGWGALVEDDYLSVFPLTQRKKFGFRYLYQPSFTQQLGLFSKKEIQENAVIEFLKALPDQYRIVEIQLNTENTFEFKIKGINCDKKLTHHLDLNRGKEELHSAYSENLKRNIRKAQKAGIQIGGKIDSVQIIEMFRMYRGRDLQNLKDRDYRILEKLTSEGLKNKSIELLGAQLPDGKFIAGAVVLRSMAGYILLFSATTPEGRETGAMSALIHSFIEKHSAEKMIFDFEGSMDPNLARFYKSYGSKEVVYLHIRKNKLPAPIRWLKNK